MKRAVLSFMMFGLLAGLTVSSYAQNGTIVGTVKLVGDVPEAEVAVVNKDQEVCGAEPKPSQKLVLSADNGIKNAFVSINGVQGEKLAVPAENHAFNQERCEFVPHLMVVPVGATVDFPNKIDKVMHNLHSYSMANRPFNKGVPHGGVISVQFEKPEVVKITCDVHKWMIGYIIVHDSPYYCLTDENGNYKIENVPPGTYQLQVWQESLGKSMQEVTVNAGGETAVNLELTPKKTRKKEAS